jgi:hypothetical protein
MSAAFAASGPPFHGGRDLFLERVLDPLAPWRAGAMIRYWRMTYRAT